MKRRRIIVFGLLNHQHVLNFSKALKEYLGYEMLGVNNNPNYLSEKSKETETIFSKIYNAQRSKIPFFDKILKSLSTITYFIVISNKVDFVLFHFLSKFIYPLAIISKWRGMKTCIFVYGSDFKRADNSYRKYIGKVFNIVSTIVCDSTDMLEEMKVDYPQYAHKMNCCFFGSPIVDELLHDNNTTIQAKEKLKICEPSKRIVMCGYNGCKEQQHLKIINSLKPFSSKVHLLFPMTYGCENDYRNEVKEYCIMNNFSFTILDKFIEDEKWRNYLFATDIFIHMQLTDAFSACVAENLLVGNIVINSEWIKYPDLDKSGAFYIPGNFNNLSLIFNDILNNYDIYLEKSANNRSIIERFKGLKYTVIHEWAPYFDSI